MSTAHGLLPLDRLLESRVNADEYERLARPWPRRTVRSLRYAALRMVMRTMGQLSCGVWLGRRTGFDSGLMFDYVYENRPRGTTVVGRLLDRCFLNQRGWQVVRRRKSNVQQALRRAIAELQAAGLPVRIVDIAAGVGRYVLEILRERPEVGASAELRDRDPRSLQAGRALAGTLGVPNVSYVQADAFDPAAFGTVPWRATVALACGIYELVPDNRTVFRSLTALHGGAYLIYTNQPWHPQLELIARVLVTSEGSPWLFRCRPQGEIDALVTAAGFDKLAMAADDQGVQTVSLARKRSGDDETACREIRV